MPRTTIAVTVAPVMPACSQSVSLATQNSSRRSRMLSGAAAAGRASGDGVDGGAFYSSTYSYAGAKSDLGGRGFLGFRQMTNTDLQTGIVHTSNYNQIFPYLGLIGSETKALGTLNLNQSTNTYQLSNASSGSTVSTPSNSSAPYRVWMSQGVASSSDLDGSTIPTVTTTYQYDAYGNATQVVTSTPDGFSKTTTNTYTNDTTNWFLGRLTNATVTSTTP
jgi:hypothetical protein